LYSFVSLPCAQRSVFACCWYNVQSVQIAYYVIGGIARSRWSIQKH